MNIENDSVEPGTDLGLALSYSTQGTQGRLHNDSGAGANAGSRLDVTFVATDPLSELVWSPHKGLSVKCTGSSLVDKYSSLLWDTGPSNMVLPPSQGATMHTNTEKPKDEGNFITSQATFKENGELLREATSAGSPRCNADVQLGGSSHENNRGNSANKVPKNIMVKEPVLHINPKEDDLGDTRGKCACSPVGMQTTATSEDGEKYCPSLQGQGDVKLADSILFKAEKRIPNVELVEPLSRDSNVCSVPFGGSGGAGDGNHKLGRELDLEVHAMELYEAPDYQMADSTSAEKKENEFALFVEKSKYKMKMPVSSRAPLEKLESTAESGLPLLNSKVVSGLASGIIAFKSARETRNISPQNEDKTAAFKHSQYNRRVRSSKRKDTGKALSGGDANRRASKEEDDNSNESVESCNSARVFLTGKKRWNFEQQLMVGSKRVKRKFDENSHSTSFVGQDSSFMNWISNMIKGFSKSDQDATPSLALTFTQPNHGPKSHYCFGNQDPECRIGFRTIFQSLYWPNAKAEDAIALNDKCQTREGTKDLEFVNKISDASGTPRFCHGETNMYGIQNLLPNEQLNQLTPKDEGSLSNQPIISPTNVATIKENCCTRNFCNPTSAAEKDIASSSNSSLNKHKTSGAENNVSDPPSEGKDLYYVNDRNNPHASLWITRFAPKTPSSSLNICHHGQKLAGSLEYSSDCMTFFPHSQNHIDSSKEQKIVEVIEYSNKDLLNCGVKESQNVEASSGWERIKSHNDGKSICKLNPFFPPLKFKRSEAMFSRRLDALKHVIPSNKTDYTACATASCFFCGRRDHDLRNCSEIGESELKDLLRNVSAYDGAEESPCLCIRCFELNHWAIACPSASSRKQCQLEFGAALLKRRSSNEKKSTESLFQLSGAHMVCNRTTPRMKTDFTLNQNTIGVMTSNKKISDSNQLKNIASNSGESTKEHHISALSNYVNHQISVIPTAVLASIKKLRLTRSDILKWMNSHISPLPLDGFFLRLRLGKWEGLGGTGYHVACITGTGVPRKKSLQSSCNPILVNIGGIKCSVESKYVSNHDFHEGELMAWWCTALKAGAKIPTEEDLREKLGERYKMGL